jgi:hypothetical protein
MFGHRVKPIQTKHVKITDEDHRLALRLAWFLDAVNAPVDTA